jgi:predicted O-linked N-acetylglucosamine transferase (SPINDLY family)/glycosyltransferase involved in cell wall biosynthesis/predicted SAM-dependent methyltransferase
MKTTTPLITVVLVTYNHENYIAEAIQSILSQTLGDFELIIVNDGSTDRTEAIIGTFSDPRIVYLGQENQGLSAAINTGVLKARGQYIAFMSGDDVCFPSRLEQQYEFSRMNPGKIVFSWVDIINEQGTIITDDHGMSRVFNVRNKTRAEILRHFFFDGNYFNAVTAFADKETVLETGLFNVASIQLQDFEYWLRLVKKNELHILPYPLIKYRIRDNGMNLSHYSRAGRTEFEHQQILRGFFEDMPADLFKAAFSGEMIRPDFAGEDEYLLEQAFLYLHHRSKAIQALGCEKLFALLQESDQLSKSISTYGFGLVEYYGLTEELDFLNSSKSPEPSLSSTLRTLRSLKSKPLVSVCIPTYNGERFLAETIHSVLSQTYQNIEIIVSDDNSTDRTIDIAKSFQQRSDIEFSIIEHEQYGMAGNWNFCISQAKGKYIKFVFQDDLLEPNAISEMVELAEQDEEIGLVFSPRTLFVTDGDDYCDPIFLESHEAKDIHEGWSELQPIQSGQKLLGDHNIFSYSINKIGEPTTVLIKKEVLDLVGGFNFDLHQLVDLEMWLRIINVCKVGFVNKYLSHFRLHRDQQTHHNSAKEGLILLDYQKFFDIIASDPRYPKSTRKKAFYRYALLSEQRSDSHQVRMKVAEELLSIADDEIEDAYKGLLGTNHEIMQFFSNQSLTKLSREEQVFAEQLKAALLQDSKEPKSIQHLLAATIYYRADQLALPCDLSQIPQWLLPNFLKFVFAVPGRYHEIGESEKYREYIEGWINYICTSALENSDDPFWQNVVDQIMSVSNFSSIYFNEENLKNIYVQRAELLDLHLKNNGHVVDYTFPIRSTTAKKLRIGILSGHFDPSAETSAALPVYEYLSRDCEVILFSLQETSQPLGKYCRSTANSFVTLPSDLSSQVEEIRSADLDILFFATNVTIVANPIYHLAAHRLARIQVTSVGSVTTTGLENMDYFLSGTLTDPSSSAQEQYQEQLLKIEGSAHCFSYGNDDTTATVQVDRNTLGIPEDAVVFTSGANFFKLVPELLHSWAKIVAGVPNSVMMLFPYGPNWSNSYPKEAFERQIHQIFAQYGVSPDRVLALDPQPTPNREDIKEFLKLADVYLDSYPFAGTTSLIEPLQVSLPVVARQGNSFRSAMGAAMIQALGMPDLVADSEASYIQIAIDLGNNPELCQQKSLEVEAKMQNNPSFLDSRGYALKVEKIFKEIFNKYNADALEQSLCLRDVNVMVFPDWNQSEEAVGMELQQVIQALASQPASQQTTLLIDTTNIAIEDAEMFISSVTMNLMMEEDFDITEELEIALIEDLSNIQWETLMPKIDARIVMECDNQAAVDKLWLNDLPQLDLASFVKELTQPSKVACSITDPETRTVNILQNKPPHLTNHSVMSMPLSDREKVAVITPPCNDSRVNESSLVIPLFSTAEIPKPIRLHIGGQESHPDWQIFDTQARPEVTFLGDAKNLSQFEDDSIDSIYASHVLEHFHYYLDNELLTTLREWRRVLRHDGKLLVSVPNLQMLCSLYAKPQMPMESRHHLMRMIFGGHTDEYDVHRVGFDSGTLTEYLESAGFRKCQIVDGFGLFRDSSILRFDDLPISLNMIATK